MLLCFLRSLRQEDMLWYLTELHAFCLPLGTKRYLFLLMCDASVCLDSVAELAAWCIFPLHALCHRHLATCFIILVTWSVTFSCRKWNCLYWQTGQRGVSCKEVKGSGETLHSENVTGRGT